MRIDLALVERKLAATRTRAQELIAKGRVFVREVGTRSLVTKASHVIGADTEIEITEDFEADRFVSRGGTKLQGALSRTGFDPQGLRVLDIGISTGGFTDCLLQAGASSVVGVDVGHGQLAEKLRGDARINLREGINARELSRHVNERFPLVVMDVSFISLTLILPEVVKVLGDGGSLLSLVKPQFEVGWKNLGKGGIVKRASLFGEVETKLREAAGAHGLVVEGYFESAIEGSDGNREFFLFAQKCSQQSP